MTEVLVRYVHFISIMVLVSSLVTEYFLLSPEVSKNTLQKIMKADILFGISAVMVLLAGLTLWFWAGKPAAYYSGNWIFHTKLSLFVLVGIISIFPTKFFIQNRNIAEEKIQIPKSILLLVKTEMLLVFLIPLLAALMAHGYGNS